MKIRPLNATADLFEVAAVLDECVDHLDLMQSRLADAAALCDALRAVSHLWTEDQSMLAFAARELVALRIRSERLQSFVNGIGEGGLNQFDGNALAA